MPQDATTPLSSIATDLSFKGDRINVFFAPPGYEAPADGSIDPGNQTAPVSEGFNAYEKAQFRTAFDRIEPYIDLSFEIVTDRTAADFTLVLDIDQFTGSTLGYFYLPNGADQHGVFNGTRWDRFPGGDLEMGGLGFATMVHEVLHGLGLDHPHDDDLSDQMDGVDKSFGDYGTADLNQGLYTMMTYNDGYRVGPVGSPPPNEADYGNQAGPMALDIAVLQDIYGANTRTNASDTVYQLDPGNDIGTHWHAIWDVGGTDTIAFDGGRDAVIDLRAATLEYETGGGGFVSAADNIAGGFTIAAGVVIENATGGRGDDVLRGNDAENALTGGQGDDTLSGGGGTDRAIFAAASSDLTVTRTGDGWRVTTRNEGTDDLFGIGLLVARDGEFALRQLADPADGGDGAPGSADIAGTSAADDIAGTGAGERLFGFAGNDTIDGSEGHDTIEGGIGFDVNGGGAGDDRLIGGNGYDTLSGDAGADTIKGGYGNDVVYGRGGNDHLDGGLGFDRMEGGEGDDRLDALDGYDTLFGGAGDDLLNGNAGNDRLFGNGGTDRLLGGIGADTLVGGVGADTILGGDGPDAIEAGAGADLLYGNAGHDRLDGGAGADRLWGGIGADEFVFAAGSGRDTILDLGAVDRIGLDADFVGAAPLASFETTIGGDLAFDFGGGDVIVISGYDSAGQIAEQIDLV